MASIIPAAEHGYAELHCLSNFSFQRGASGARELFERAKLHGYPIIILDQFQDTNSDEWALNRRL